MKAKKGFSGLYRDGPEWSGGFIKRVEMAKKEKKSNKMRRKWADSSFIWIWAGLLMVILSAWSGIIYLIIKLMGG